MFRKILCTLVLTTLLITACGDNASRPSADNAEPTKAASGTAVAKDDPKAGNGDDSNASGVNEEKEDDPKEDTDKDSNVTDENEEKADAAEENEDEQEYSDVNSVDGSWSAYFGMFIEVEERDASEEEMLELYRNDQACPMRELWLSYDAETNEYTFNISLGNEQLWGATNSRPDGVTAIEGTWFDVGVGENLGNYPFYALLSGDGRHVYMSYDYAGQAERTAAPVSEGTGETFVLLGIHK